MEVLLCIGKSLKILHLGRMLEIFPYICWIPLVLWLGLFFVSRYVIYPQDLKKRLKSGDHWVYIPGWWKAKGGKMQFARLSFILLWVLTVVCSAFDIYLVLGMVDFANPEYGLASAVVFAVLAVVLYKSASGHAFKMEQATFYLFIQRLHVEDQKKGIAATMDNLRSRSTWELQRTLKRAEERGSLLKYLKVAASTKKFPKELYTEVVR